MVNAGLRRLEYWILCLYIYRIRNIEEGPNENPGNNRVGTGPLDLSPTKNPGLTGRPRGWPVSLFIDN